jgi:hypothetical protein
MISIWRRSSLLVTVHPDSSDTQVPASGVAGIAAPWNCDVHHDEHVAAVLLDLYFRPSRRIVLMVSFMGHLLDVAG